MILLAIVTGLAALTAHPVAPASSIADLRQTIWSACNDLPPIPPGKPPQLGWVRACDARRRSVIATLWRLGTSGAPGQRIDALELVAAWAPPQLARMAFDRLVSTYGNVDALAPAIEAGYQESRSPDKLAQLRLLARTSRSRAVVGAATYLLAADTLAKPDVSPAARRQAIAVLHRVAQSYGDLPTRLLGGGDPPRLGHVAEALLFRTERLRPGVMLPPMAAQDLDGRPVTSAAFRGKVTLIDFWATWCPPCVAAMPTLRRTQATYRANGLQIVSISADAGAESVKAFVARNGNPWPQWRIGPSGVVSPDWSNNSYPFYILVNRQGRIAAVDQELAKVLRAVGPTLR